MLYALGVGCGSDPDEAGDLKFVYERGLAALPTMAVVLAYPGNWLESPAVDSRLQQGAARRAVAGAASPAGTIRHRDRPHAQHGPARQGHRQGRRAVHRARDLRQGERRADRHHDGNLHAARRRRFRRQGRPAAGTARAARDGTGAPRRHQGRRPTPRSIYRLSGDRNPLHADPKAAAAGGFAKPILHGLCTYGVAGRAIIRACCGNDPARLRALQVRFSAPVYPGETVRTEMWPDGERVSFRARVLERDVVVLNNGLARVDLKRKRAPEIRHPQSSWHRCDLTPRPAPARSRCRPWRWCRRQACPSDSRWP